VENIES